MNFIVVFAGRSVEKEMSTWVFEIGVMRGFVRISEALTRFS